MTLSTLLAISLLFSAAEPPAVPLQAVKVTDTSVTRSIDCKGGNLTVTGDADKLTVSRCVKINVVGNHNQMTVQLLPESVIAALGDGNHIIFVHATGFEARVSSTGVGNEIVPQMTRDLQFTSPVKYPIAPH